MTYGGIQMFMKKLNQLINSNDNPFINSPSVIDKRPQFQLLRDELGSMIQTLFIDQHHQHLEKLNDLKQRFIYASEGTQYIVDLFLSSVYICNTQFPTYVDDKPSLDLDDVRISLKFIKAEFDSMKMDSSPRPQKTLNQSSVDVVAAQSFMSRNSLGSKKLIDEIFVGIDRDAEIIRDKLVEDQKKLDVVSIVGTGGIGKTTLATKVFNDGYVKHYFHIRVWVTVSQTYDKRGVLLQILESIRGQLDLEKASDSRLHELVNEHLMDERYLIVIDDIWDREAWDNLKLFFPRNNNGSRILLTSRHTEVAKHANSDGLIHHLEYLSKEKSWDLLCQKVFHGNESPEWSIKHGMQIVQNCKGLPLAVVVIGGVLAKDAWSQKFWVEIVDKTGSYIVGEENGCMETLGLSYNHLPLHLRECFLYLGGFPEDYKFQAQWLIWLWVAEGFIQEDGNRRLEDIAEGYLMDLIDRNLVIVAGMSNSYRGVKACKVHDLVRELCLEKAKEERFILQTERLILFPEFSNGITPPYKPVRMLMNKHSNLQDFVHSSTQNLRSVLFFKSYNRDITYYLRYFVILRVLDLRGCPLWDFPTEGLELLVHLRYLAIWHCSGGFPSSICKLWSLQTLIYFKDYLSVLPRNISNLVNLRHLSSFLPFTGKSKRVVFLLPSIEKPMSLQTISGVKFGDGVHDIQKCFPYIKELTCTTNSKKSNDFKSLTYLEKLKLTSSYGRVDRITFPRTLKTLTLAGCGLPWSEMSIIQSLPNLQVLKLKSLSFMGSCWNTDGQEFRQLKFLRLEGLDIQVWEADTTTFSCLRQLEIMLCKELEEVPLEIGDIPTLVLIKINKCSQSLGESVRRIEEEQQDLGNYDLKIHISEDI